MGRFWCDANNAALLITLLGGAAATYPVAATHRHFDLTEYSIWRGRLLRGCLNPATQVHLTGPTAIDDARRVRGNAFRHVGVGRNFGNEGRHLAVFCAADANALLEAGVDLAVRIARLMVGRIEIVVPIDI